MQTGFTLRIAVTSDFHARTGDMKIHRILPLLAEEKPDLILAPGDFFNNTHESSVREPYNIHALELPSGMRKIAPVYYSVGNHEHGLTADNRKILEENGIIVLDNEVLRHENLVLGGLSSGYVLDKSAYRGDPIPTLDVIDEMESIPGFRILLSHHPEYSPRYLADRQIHLTVSGHAHGGQWRIGSRGVFAPGQGLFPKYVSGLYPIGNGTLCVSRGMRNTVRIPRFFNPCEIVILDLVK